jgi:hypothetical protein
MDKLFQLFKDNDPQGYYSLEDIQQLCKDPKFEMIFENIQNIFDTNQILTPDIRDYLYNSNYDAGEALQIEGTRQEYGLLYNIDNWESSLS